METAVDYGGMDLDDDDERIQALLDRIGTLTRVELDDNDLTGDVVQQIAASASTLLTTLSLNGNQLDAESVRYLEPLVPQLTSLSLAQNHIGDLGARLLSSAIGNAGARCKLRRLNVADNEISRQGCVSLAEMLLAPVQAVSDLRLDGNDVGNLAARIIADALSKPTCRLKHLSVQGCDIGSSGLSQGRPVT